ncbi:hypothetical protein RKD19_002131 [Streptomyces canus]
MVPGPVRPAERHGRNAGRRPRPALPRLGRVAGLVQRGAGALGRPGTPPLRAGRRADDAAAGPAGRLRTLHRRRPAHRHPHRPECRPRPGPPAHSTGGPGLLPRCRVGPDPGSLEPGRSGLDRQADGPGPPMGDPARHDERNAPRRRHRVRHGGRPAARPTRRHRRGRPHPAHTRSAPLRRGPHPRTGPRPPPLCHGLEPDASDRAGPPTSRGGREGSEPGSRRLRTPAPATAPQRRPAPADRRRPDALPRGGHHGRQRPLGRGARTAPP